MTIGLLCPGQGGQTASTLSELLADSTLAPLTNALLQHLSPALVNSMSDPAACMANATAQPLVVLAGVVVAQALEDFDITAVAGYSVGEVTAQHACGGLSAVETIKLAEQRGQAMTQHASPDCGLVAVTQVRVEALAPIVAQHHCHLAIVNGEDHAVVAGRLADLSELTQALTHSETPAPSQPSSHASTQLPTNLTNQPRGAQVVKLPVTIPSHSPLMAGSDTALQSWLDQQSWPTANIPLLSGLNGYSLYSSNGRKASLVKQMTHTVHWHRTMQSMVESGCKVFFEVGPGNALSRMLASAFPGVVVRSVADFSSFEGAATWLKAQVNRA